MEVDRMAEKYSIQELKDIVTPLAQKYGAQRVYLFGSYARRDMTESSDVDLRIDKGSIRGLALAGFGGCPRPKSRPDPDHQSGRTVPVLHPRRRGVII